MPCRRPSLTCQTIRTCHARVERILRGSSPERIRLLRDLMALPACAHPDMVEQLERGEVPLGTGGFQNVLSLDPFSFAGEGANFVQLGCERMIIAAGHLDQEESGPVGKDFPELLSSFDKPPRGLLFTGRSKLYDLAFGFDRLCESPRYFSCLKLS